MTRNGELYLLDFSHAKILVIIALLLLFPVKTAVLEVEGYSF
jgi:hypothetical protein